MAILNFTKDPEKLKKYIGDTIADEYKLALVFSSNGHIITHGIDYTNYILTEAAKLVPSAASKVENLLIINVNSETLVSYDGSSLQVANITVPTELNIKDLINQSVTSAVKYQGTVNKTTSLPTNPAKGDMWLVGEAGTYNSVVCEAGDAFIYTGDKWTTVQNNIYLSSAQVNGSSAGVYGTANWNLYAPTSSGTSGLLLISTGSTPEWKSFSQFIASASKLGFVKPGSNDAAKKVYGVLVDTNGAMTVSVPWVNDNTWRTVKIGGTSIGNKSLNFAVPSNCVAVTSSTDNEATISFDLRWYDLDTDKWE